MDEAQKAIEKVYKFLLSRHISTFLDEDKGSYLTDVSNSDAFKKLCMLAALLCLKGLQ